MKAELAFGFCGGNESCMPRVDDGVGGMVKEGGRGGGGDEGRKDRSGRRERRGN